jgi:Zn-dependent protease
VRVHPLFWIVALLIGIQVSEILMDAVMWVVAVFFSILIHELGHATVMRAYGYAPWITLYGFGGLASYNPAYIRQGSRGPGSLGQIVISAAGPGAGFLLAAALCAVLHFAGPGFVYGFLFRVLPVVQARALPSPVLTNFVNFVFFVCIFWGYINLLPVYPLDGGQIARELFLRFDRRFGIRNSLMLSMFTAVAMAVFFLVKWDDYFLAFLFGWMAFSNYVTLQAYQGRSPW